MLLGTFHFEGSQTDAVSGRAEDMRTPARQTELEALVTRLARWAPEQVAVEYPASLADTLTAVYARYVARGGVTASSNEVVQVGFRLARRLGHPAVYAIDHQMPIGNDSLDPLLARRADLRARADSVLRALRQQSAAPAPASTAVGATTLVERLYAVNTDAALHAGNSGAMFSWLGTGEGDNRGGPQLLARWYERNFYMAHNLTRALRPGIQRVLVIVGDGHVPPLRTILDESPQYCPVSPLPYLH